MKKSIAILLTFVILFAFSVCFADQARFLKDDGNQAYHAEHLLLHVGSQNCKVAGNYIKIRDAAGSSNVLGHLEQSDVFTLDYMNGSWAHITVAFSAKTSPDSYTGLSGWVDGNYVECPCSYNEYYYGPAHTTYSTGIILQDKTYLREDPAKNSVSLTKVNKGDQVDILSEYTGKDGKLWYRVRFNQQVGFIRSDLLNIIATEISESETASTRYEQENSASTVGSDSPAVVSSGDSWQDLYRAFILNKEYERISYPDYLPDGYDFIAMTNGSDQLEYVGYDYDPIWFSLYDLDNDQTPELLIFNGIGYMAGNFCHVYTFQNHSMKYLGQLGRRELFLTYSNDRSFPGLVQTDGNMGFYTTDYWYIKDGEILVETIESISDHPDPEEAEYDGSGDDAIITRETANTALYNWYHSFSFSSLPHWEYSEILEKGWDMFVSAMLYQPSASQTSVAAEPPQNIAKDEPSESYTWETAMFFEDVLLDSDIYDGSWPEAYLSVLRAKETNIRNYQSQIDEILPYLAGQPLYILFQDINGDETPEMLLISDTWAEPGMRGYCDFYVYSHDGSHAKCVLSIPEVYKEVEAGASYSIFIDGTDSGTFVVQYYDGWGIWQVRYDSADNFQRLDTLRGVYYKASDEDEQDTYYLNGNQISYQEFQTRWISSNSDTVTLLGSTAYSPAASGMKYDAAIQHLSSLLSVNEGTDQGNTPSSDMVDFGVANEDVLFVSEGYYYVDNYNTEDYYSFIPVDVFSNKETYRANDPIKFSADILGGTPPFTVTWSVEESQTRDGPTPLDRYMESHEDYSSSISYTTNCRHVEYVYTPPVESTTLFGCFSVTDSRGISSYSPNENLAAVDTLAEWNELYPQVGRPEDESFPFAARTNKKNVNVRNGIGKEQAKLTTFSSAGTLVKVIGKGYDSTGKKWYIVRFGIDQIGCIRSDFLTFE